jgi:hypothetical protein
MGPHLFQRHPHPEPAQLIGEWKFKGDDASVNNFLDQYVPILYITDHRETPVSLGAPCPYRPPCAGPIGDPFLGAHWSAFFPTMFEHLKLPASIKNRPCAVIRQEAVGILLTQMP